ncbi:hypothetical protein F5J12DRAFT_852603 [Pisolithus orientalis]|uniref:uncharacterized protein n=1 Tax=Pisolithus orientalis TaxID=936130 RepID=UPI002224D0E1|nr:uncharacterized protein F5J12DRAFT_852603 [Pisolithus orientalis]KAI5996865.1 hypothetical protein F5J12DRAFT_852603 [Pisolithus orientalis]
MIRFARICMGVLFPLTLEGISRAWIPVRVALRPMRQSAKFHILSPVSLALHALATQCRHDGPASRSNRNCLSGST